jgi:hypothetical protein
VSPQWFWQVGGEATLLALDGERVELVSTRPFAPGSRPEARLQDHQPVWIKVQASRGQPDGTFLVSGRLLNATRALRAALEQALLSSPPPAPSSPPPAAPAPSDKDHPV